MENKMSEENKYLKYAYKCIEIELIKAEQSLKNLLTKKVTYDDAKRGEQFTQMALIDMYRDKIKRLKRIVTSPYFGRFDFTPKDTNINNIIYVGKTNVFDDNRKQVIVDWRSPISSLYYDGFVGEACYEAPQGLVEGIITLKRQIIIENSILKKVLDIDFSTNDEMLQDYLDIHADNKMKNIIASIQKEQNEIIRKPISKNIIVQGVAGSGKTSVALHRIAYLTYNDNSTSKDFLVLGPNSCFLSYISELLPELETDPVMQFTYLDLVNNYLNSKLKLEKTMFNQNNRQVYEKYQSLKTSIAFKNALDNYVNNYIENDMITEGISIEGEEIYSKDYIKKCLFNGIYKNPNFKKAESMILDDFKERKQEIYSMMNEKYRQIYINLPKGDVRRDEALQKSEKLRKVLFDDGVKTIKKNLKSKKISVMEIYIRFIMNMEKYIENLSNKEFEEFKLLDIKKLSKNKVAFEDLPALLHIGFLIGNKTENFKHIVVDEAQDLGVFHFKALKEIFPNSTFSIYGDLAQSICSYSSISNWNQLSNNVFNNNCEILNLNKSYRTTIEITEIANEILKQVDLLTAHPVIRHGKEVQFINCAEDSEYRLNKIKEWLNKKYETIAIICKDEKEASKIYHSLKKENLEITYVTNNIEQYKGKVFVLTCELAKGLEFDAVMINNASNQKYSIKSKFDMNLLYVATTRALHELEVLYDNHICDVFSDFVEKDKKIKKLNKK